MAHASLPTLCPDCEREALSLAEMFPKNQLVVWTCTHHGTLAIGCKRKCAVVAWNLRGPFSPEDLEAMMKKLAAEIEGDGTPVKPVSRQ
jgi:hypothetical protein